MRALGYVRCSTREQTLSGLGLKAQTSAIRDAARSKGWRLTMIEDAGATGATTDRPGLQSALTLLARGKADALIVSKLDRLSRSVVDFAQLMERSRREEWSIIALDLGLDTSSAAGELMATILASFSQFERRMISIRTKDALSELKASGKKLGGSKRLVSPEALDLIVALSESRNYSSIARELDARALPTPRGAKRWSPSVVSSVIRGLSAA